MLPRVFELRACVWILVGLGVGRVLLSLLPAGRPGSHAWNGLGATLATSLFLGELALRAERGLTNLAGAPFDPTRPAHVGLLLAPWALLLAIRLGTLPGGLVPGHELAHERRGALALGIGALAFAVLVARFALLDAPPLSGQTAAAAAALTLTGYGLLAARRAPVGRAVVLVVVGCLLLPPGFPALATALGSASLVVWVRRSDRRAGWLAALGFAAAPAAVAVFGLLALVVASRPRQRAQLARVLPLPLALRVALELAPGEPLGPTPEGLALLSCVLPALAIVAGQSLLRPEQPGPQRAGRDG